MCVGSKDHKKHKKSKTKTNTRSKNNYKLQIPSMALHDYLSSLMAEMHTSASEVSIVSDNSYPSPTARKKAQVRIVALARQGSMKRRQGRLCPVKRWESDSSLDFDVDDDDDDYDVETEYDLERSPTTRSAAAGATTKSSRAAKMSMMRKSKSDTSLSMPLRTVSPRLIKQPYRCPVVIESPTDNNNESLSASQNATWGMMRQSSMSKIGSTLPSIPTRRGSITSNSSPAAAPGCYYESSPELLTMKKKPMMNHHNHGLLSSSSSSLGFNNSSSSSSKMSSLRNALGSMAPTINKNSKKKLSSSSTAAAPAKPTSSRNNSLILSPNSFLTMAYNSTNSNHNLVVGNSSMTSITSSTSVSLSPSTACYGGMTTTTSGGRRGGAGVAAGVGRLPFDTRNLQEDSLDFLCIDFD